MNQEKEPCLCGIAGCYGHQSFTTSDGRTFLQITEGRVVQVTPRVLTQEEVEQAIAKWRNRSSEEVEHALQRWRGAEHG